MSKSRILLIDDDEGVRALVGAWLENAGYETILAEDGSKGAQLYYEDPPDLIITDIFMPSKDGMEMLVELRRYFAQVKIIVMSGWGEQHLRVAKVLGAWGTIGKPFDREKLIELVAKALAEEV